MMLRRRFFSVVLCGSAVWLAAPFISAQAVSADDAMSLKQLSLADLMQVQVTSVARYPQEMLYAPSSIEVITNDEIVRSTALTLPEALRLADNLQVAQKNAHDWAISARGFNANISDKMLVLIDGRSVYTPLWAGVTWNSQDYVLEDIDRIEVVSGPGGTLWGANAVNGVINVRTKSADRTQGVYTTATVGTDWQGAVAARYGGMLAPDVYYRVYGKMLTEADSKLRSGGRAHDSWQQAQGGFRVDAHPGSDNAFTVQGDTYSGDLEILTGNTARLAGGNLLGRWTRRTTADGEFSVQAYVDRTHLADPIQVTNYAPAGFLREDIDTYDLDFQHSFHPFDQHHLVWGLGYRHILFREPESAPNLAFLPTREIDNLANAFVQDEIALTSDVSLILGSKLEHNSFTGWEVEPNARVRWTITSSQILWAAVSRAVRTPARFDRDLAEPAPPKTLISGNPQMRSETLWAYELGYRAQLSRNTALSIATFYNDYDKLRGLGTTPQTVLPLVYGNHLDAKTYGAELAVDYKVRPWWNLHAGYNFLHERVRVKPGQVDFFNALDETEDPKHQWNLRSSMDLPHQLQWDAQLRWVDSLTVNNSGQPATVPSYYELDTRLGWKVTPATEISIGGSNLLHASHAEYGVPDANQVELRRYVYAKFEWYF